MKTPLTLEEKKKLCCECLSVVIQETATKLAYKYTDDELQTAIQKTLQKFLPIVSEFPAIDACKRGMVMSRDLGQDFRATLDVFEGAVKRRISRLRVDIATQKASLLDTRNSDHDERLCVLSQITRPRLVVWMDQENKMKKSSLPPYTEAMLDHAMDSQMTYYTHICLEFPVVYENQRRRKEGTDLQQTPEITSYLTSAIKRFVLEETRETFPSVPFDDGFDIEDKRPTASEEMEKQEEMKILGEKMVLSTRNTVEKIDNLNKVKTIIIILLRYLTGKPQKEIADIFGLNNASVFWTRIVSEIIDEWKQSIVRSNYEPSDCDTDISKLGKQILTELGEQILKEMAFQANVREAINTLPEEYQQIITNFTAVIDAEGRND